MVTDGIAAVRQALQDAEKILARMEGCGAPRPGAPRPAWAKMKVELRATLRAALARAEGL